MQFRYLGGFVRYVERHLDTRRLTEHERSRGIKFKKTFSNVDLPVYRRHLYTERLPTLIVQ